MISKIIHGISIVKTASDAAAIIDGENVTLTGTIGSVHYAVAFTRRVKGFLPRRGATLVTITKTEGETSAVVQLPLLVWWWKLRVNLFLRRTLKQICMERARVALGE